MFVFLHIHLFSTPSLDLVRKSERMSEVRGGETYISYPSSKVPKSHVESLSPSSTSVRPSYPALTP